MEALHARVEQLERSLRRQRATSLLVIVAFSVVVLSAAAQQDVEEPAAPITEHLKVRKLTIVDAEGNPLIDLDEGAEGGLITMQNPDGRVLVFLGSYERDATILHMNDPSQTREFNIDLDQAASLYMQGGAKDAPSSLWAIADENSSRLSLHGGGAQGVSLLARGDEDKAGGELALFKVFRHPQIPDGRVGETYFSVSPTRRIDFPEAEIKRTSD